MQSSAADQRDNRSLEKLAMKDEVYMTLVLFFIKYLIFENPLIRQSGDDAERQRIYPKAKVILRRLRHIF